MMGWLLVWMPKRMAR
uniref:Uncharacterized protein n=1 Tax=Anguilla anguilla TaxID=7936 RepID=A0A0E9TW61_ANGAN